VIASHHKLSTVSPHAFHAGNSKLINPTLLPIAGSEVDLNTPRPRESEKTALTLLVLPHRSLRAGLVVQAQVWRWSSLGRYYSGDTQARALLARWPLPRPRGWVAYVNAPQTEAELEALRRALRRSSPFGNPEWQQTIAKRFGLEATLRPRGRARKCLQE
jgi:putative transposase